MTALEMVDVSKTFPLRRRRKVHAVSHVSLALERGKITAVIGESGSGKSTIARLMAQLYKPTSGQIKLDGQPVEVRNGRQLRKYVGDVQLILQDPFGSFNPVHTIEYALRRAVTIHHGKLPASELDARVGALLEEVRLTPPRQFLAKYPHELSGGQRQRISIARALAASPTVLLADEPVSMLDVSIRLGVLNLLERLVTERDLALLYITHDIASARYFADDTLVMYAGRMVEGGDSETVTQAPAHPYTQLLIDSAPDPDRIQNMLGDDSDRGNGEPPSLISPPAGCRFHPRCPMAMPRCTVDLPVRIEIGDGPGHWAACWLYDEATVAAQRPGSAARPVSPAPAPRTDDAREEVR